MAELAGATVEGTAQAPGDFTVADDPFALFQAWFAEATSAEINDPNAMSLATVDGDGLPNVRIVLLKGLDGPEDLGAQERGAQVRGARERGFVFFTNMTSAKGRELDGTPKAALLFHWKSLRRQVRIRGSVAPISAEESDEYYGSRPRGSRIGAWASRQSEGLASREVLEAEVRRLEAAYPGDSDIPRPPHWGGYRLVPLEIEFWCERPFRLHDRAVFRRSVAAAGWTRSRLYP